MRAPSFWYKPLGLEAIFLWPLGLIYRAVSNIKQLVIRPYNALVPIICVGNIVAGGAGKTPAALVIAQILQQHGQNPVFVTRGYGGKERGPLRVDLSLHSALDVGDEALLLARIAPTWIGRNRAAAVSVAQAHGSHVIMDDGLQNPSIKPKLSFLVIDGSVGIGNGCLIPAGPLRETLEKAMPRITGVIFIGSEDRQKLIPRFRCPLFRAEIEPDLPPDFPRQQKFFAFCGIGRPEKFYETCRRSGIELVGTKDFSDHHFFSTSELQKLQTLATTEGAKLLTTEKDWARLPGDFQSQILSFPINLIFNDPVAITQLVQNTTIIRQ